MGICLGAQLLAEVLGGRAEPGASGPEWGPVRVTVDPRSADPVLAGQSGTYFSMHDDAFTVPPKAELLAWSDRYPQAFRLGSALGLQFHPEISPAGVRRLASAQPASFRQAGTESAALVEWATANEASSRQRAETLVGNWARREVARSSRALSGRHPEHAP